jgi:ribosomal protein S18 acetylase RimI-like enzyme
MADIETRRLRAAEWRQLRGLRLQALQDAPLAFGSTYDREAAYTDEQWQREAAGAELGVDEVGFVAVADGAHVGMARGYVATRDEPDPRKVVWLIGVYVHPRWRGRGLGRALSAEVITWARERDATAVLLHVADWNASARHAYESLGFVPTGKRTTLAHDPTIPEAEMRLGL